jgi:hypothetical protein
MTPLRSRCQRLQMYMRSILRSEYGTDKEDIYNILITNLWANPANFEHADAILRRSKMSLFTSYFVRIVTACSFTTYEKIHHSFRMQALPAGATEPNQQVSRGVIPWELLQRAGWPSMNSQFYLMKVLRMYLGRMKMNDSPSELNKSMYRSLVECLWNSHPA